MYMFGVLEETQAHGYLEVILFYNSNDILHSPICQFPIYYVMCVICMSNKQKNISKTKPENQKLKDNLLCYFRCSFK